MEGASQEIDANATLETRAQFLMFWACSKGHTATIMKKAAKTKPKLRSDDPRWCEWWCGVCSFMIELPSAFRLPTHPHYAANCCSC